MNRTILFAEENEHHRALLKTALRAVGLDEDLHMVKDGQEALDYLRGSERIGGEGGLPAPRLVLFGLNPPHAKSLGLLGWIRDQPRLDGTVVIAIASAPDAETIRKAYQLRVNSILSEPTRKEGWQRIARALKEYWFGLNLKSTLAPRSAATKPTRLLGHNGIRSHGYLNSERNETRPVLQPRR